MVIDTFVLKVVGKEESMVIPVNLLMIVAILTVIARREHVDAQRAIHMMEVLAQKMKMVLELILSRGFSTEYSSIQKYLQYFRW